MGMSQYAARAPLISMPNSPDSYEPLLLQENEGSEKPPLHRSLWKRLFDNILFISISVILLCLVANVGILLAIFSRGAYLSPQDPLKLEFRSTYVGFDKLYGNKSTVPFHPPFSNRAHRYFHLFANDPNMHLPSSPPHTISAGGYIPTAKHLYELIVTPDISTLTEFRIIDWGMENCSLILSIPHQNTSETQVIIYGEASLDISKLSFKEPLTRRTLSRNNRLPRGEHIATVPLSYGSHYSLSQFDCPSGSHYAFEVSCRDCYVNVTHSGQTEDVLYLLQSQS